MNNEPSFIRKLFSFLVLILVISIFIFVIFNRQALYDIARRYSYYPSGEISKIASTGGLNDKGTFLLYIGQPTILDKSTFSTKCGNSEQGTAVLGCYTGGNIYIFNVTEARLEGIKEVTAAHEMLHVAYDRLSETERRDVNELIEQEYRKLLLDASLSTRMQYYERVEPGQKYNELHSIIGTEIVLIDPRLEAYYKKYFDSRATVVGLHTQYASVFTELESRSGQLATSINQTVAARNQLIESYQQKQTQLSSDIESFKSRQRSNSMSSAEEKALAEQLNGRIASLNNELEVIKQRVSVYDTEIQTMKQDLEVNQTSQMQLNESMNSSLEPASGL